MIVYLTDFRVLECLIIISNNEKFGSHTNWLSQSVVEPFGKSLKYIRDKDPRDFRHNINHFYFVHDSDALEAKLCFSRIIPQAQQRFFFQRQ